MDILIKSFNRPFYLDRCVQSIKTNVDGQYRVRVLDDGTPEQYLIKIQEKHPDIEILKSTNYYAKTRAIRENLKTGKEIDGFSIPTDLWRSAAEEASDYFIMTEDDVWFTQKINTDHLSSISKAKKINLLKLGWLGNTSDDKNIVIEELNDSINKTIPKKLFLSNPMVMDCFFYNRYKFFSLMYKLALVDNATQRKYWVLNSILMGLWNKEYWLFVWKDAQGKVDEKQQLKNAAIYYRKHKDNENFVARLKDEVMKTTFQSSATGSYHPYGYNFDVNLFNHIINEAWLHGAFDSMQNFPKDFSPAYFEQFVSDKVDVSEFRKWAEHFKNQYKNLGAKVD